jgi:heat shock protein beta
MSSYLGHSRAGGEWVPPLFEILPIQLYRGLQFQDTAKKGLKFGDEDSNEAEKQEEEEHKVEFAPLISYLKNQTEEFVRDGNYGARLF